MSETVKISLIMSVYNGEEYLAEAIDSILNQTFSDFELIVINDCSSDGTSAILSRYAEQDARVKVHTNETNLRLPASLNKAISLAGGKYIARMDADDICLPDRLEKQYAFMEEHPDVSLSSCRFMTLKNGVISSGGCGARTDSEAIKALLLVTNPILHPGIIAKADAMRTLLYDKTFTCTEDMELWSRFVMAKYRIEIQDEYLMIYRLHDKQITQTTLERQHREVIAIQKKYFAEMLSPMNEEREEYYIRGIYFRENEDVSQFCAFLRWMKSENRKKGAVKKDALQYAMMEILAEHKRKGLSKASLIRAMLYFDIPFLIRELPARKKRAALDGQKCIACAEKIGLVQTGGSLSFPTFSQREI